MPMIRKHTVGAIALPLAAIPAHAAVIDISSGFVELAAPGVAPDMIVAPDMLVGALVGSTPGEGTLTVGVAQTDTSLRLSGLWDDEGVASAASGRAGIQTSLTVDEDIDIVLSWDMTATPNAIWNFFGGEFFFSYSPSVTELAGSETFPLEAGVSYTLENGISGFDGRPTLFTVSGVESFIQLELVPTPGGAALLLAALPVAFRRRRA